MAVKELSNRLTESIQRNLLSVKRCTHLIKKEDGHANWEKSSDEVYNQWRAFSKWPVLFSFFKGKSGQNTFNRTMLELE